MNRQRLYTCLLQNQSQFLNTYRCIIPPQACFYSYRQISGGIHYGSRHPLHQPQIFQAGRTGAFFDDLKNRTAKVEDRKSTRLNSSHVAISYAVFCLKKKKNKYKEDE